jgi:hypothetical protein
MRRLAHRAVERRHGSRDRRDSRSGEAGLRLPVDVTRVLSLLMGGMGSPGAVFAAVTEEVGRLLAVDYANLGRYEPDGAFTVVAVWGRTGRHGIGSGVGTPII